MCTLSCHAKTVVAEPDLSGAQSAVMVVVEDGTQRAYGIEITDTGTEWPGVAVHGEVEIHLLLFTCGLARLGLEAGLIELDRRGDRVNLLPPAVRELHLSALDGAWTAASAQSPSVQDALRFLPLAADAACTHRRAQLRPVTSGAPVDGHNGPAFATPLHDGTALVASRNGYYYRVARDGAVSRLPRLIDADPRAAHVMQDGTVYLLDAQGALHRGRVDGAFTPVHTDPELALEDGLAAMTGPTSADDPFELFVSTTQRSLRRFDGSTWVVTATAAPPRFLTALLPAIQWMGPGRAAATGFEPEGDGLALYEQGSAQVIVAPSEKPPGKFNTAGLGYTATQGLLVGFEDGSLRRYRSGNWEVVPTGGVRRYAFLIQPLPRDGLLVGGVISLVGVEVGFGQWFEDLGFCTPERLSRPAATLSPIDDSSWVLLTVGNPFADQAFDIEVLEQAEPPAACSGP